MKKYIPSAKNNNEMKESVLQEIKALIFKLERGKHDLDLDKETMEQVIASLKTETEEWESCIGTGKEDIESLYESANSQLKELKKQTEQSFVNRVETAADDLSYTISIWRAVLDGETDNLFDEEEIKKQRLTRTRKKLNGRLEELNTIKNDFSINEKRLEKDIKQLEKDLAELDATMLNEDNERKINELFHSISSLKSKLDMLAVRKANYSTCYNTLDIIYALASEIVTASDFAGEEIGKAKALLNLSKLRAVITEPDKAIAILKRMQSDINEIAEKTKAMDNKVFGLNMGTAAVSDDALKYKEELMRKKREKEKLKADGDGLDTVKVQETKTDVSVGEDN